MLKKVQLWCLRVHSESISFAISRSRVILQGHEVNVSIPGKYIRVYVSHLNFGLGDFM